MSTIIAPKPDTSGRAKPRRARRGQIDRAPRVEWGVAATEHVNSRGAGCGGCGEGMLASPPVGVEQMVTHPDAWLHYPTAGRDQSGPYGRAIASLGQGESVHSVRETLSPYLNESDVARRWWALSRDAHLPLCDDTICQVRFLGRPGGSMGPDVRDAVLIFTSGRKSLARGVSTRHWDEKPVVGDVEFHIRSSDWFAHVHHTDPRYNNVVLHVVMIYDDETPIRRQDGSIIPTCSLNDLPPAVYDPPAWPCQQSISRMSDAERTRLLNFAGLLRFEQKTQTLLALLRAAQPQGNFSAYDICLIAALAEGLGYGRDRAFFRAAGLHLLDMLSKGDIPEPLGHTDEPSPLDASRLRILSRLVQKWRIHGLWETLREICNSRGGSGGGCGDGVLAPPWGGVGQTLDDPDMLPTAPQGGASTPSPRPAAPAPTVLLAIQEIRAIFEGLSTARTDILICNVVLPFVAAVGLLENDTRLEEQAEILYARYPALTSNAITRAMCRQLQLGSEPQSACQQQGLHYIYATTCREKQCARCIAGKYEWRML